MRVFLYIDADGSIVVVAFSVDVGLSSCCVSFLKNVELAIDAVLGPSTNDDVGGKYVVFATGEGIGDACDVSFRISTELVCLL